MAYTTTDTTAATGQEPEPVRRCAYCRGPMHGRRPQARTCSDRCRQALSRQKRNADQAWDGLERFGSVSPEEAYRVRLARSGRGQEPDTRGSWWVCACGRIVALNVTNCPLCATTRPQPRLLDLMAAGMLPDA